ncbi:hypothetical protein J6590_006313 [Homalodisca vitripennis]|nr:hypothetical protein J6590_006313 [Homalodisca vitripennis]
MTHPKIGHIGRDAWISSLAGDDPGLPSLRSFEDKPIASDDWNLSKTGKFQTKDILRQTYDMQRVYARDENERFHRSESSGVIDLLRLTIYLKVFRCQSL